jgi:hypothetical protein
MSMKYYMETTALIMGDVWGSGFHPVCKEGEQVKGSCYEEISEEEYNKTMAHLNKLLHRSSL